MISVQIVLHCFAHEIDEFQRIVWHLKRNLGMVDGVSWNFKFVLNMSTKTYDWKESKIDTEFFMSKFEYICSTLPHVDKDIVFHQDYGCNSIRRDAARFSESDYICYLDTDLHFSIYTLYYLSESLKTINNLHLDGVILSAQILRLWDDSWNIISNDDFIDMGVESKIWLKYDPFTIDSDVYRNDLSNKIKLKMLPHIKFGGGWFNILSTKLLRFIDIPDSLGPYGRDDTYVADAANLMVSKGKDVKQYIVDYLLVCENRLYREYEPYKNYLTLTEDRDEYKKRNAEKAENGYRNELMKFEERIQ